MPVVCTPDQNRAAMDDLQSILKLKKKLTEAVEQGKEVNHSKMIIH